MGPSCLTASVPCANVSPFLIPFSLMQGRILSETVRLIHGFL